MLTSAVLHSDTGWRLVDNTSALLQLQSLSSDSDAWCTQTT